MKTKVIVRSQGKMDVFMFRLVYTLSIIPVKTTIQNLAKVALQNHSKKCQVLPDFHLPYLLPLPIPFKLSTIPEWYATVPLAPGNWNYFSEFIFFTVTNSKSSVQLARGCWNSFPLFRSFKVFQMAIPKAE